MDCCPYRRTRLPFVCLYFHTISFFLHQVISQVYAGDVLADRCAGGFFKYITFFAFLSSVKPAPGSENAFLIQGAISLSKRYQFAKPNDQRALNLMNAAACAVVKDMTDLCIAYGVSDEYRYAHF